MVVDKTYLKEFVDAPVEEISSYEASIEALEANYTFRPTVFLNSYHAHVVRHELTSNIPDKMADLVDELQAAFEDEYQIGDGILPSNTASDSRMDARQTLGKESKDCGKGK